MIIIKMLFLGGEGGGGDYFICCRSRKPLILPNINPFAISNSPPSTSFNYFQPIEDAPPSIRKAGTKFCIKHITMQIIFRFIQLGH